MIDDLSIAIRDGITEKFIEAGFILNGVTRTSAGDMAFVYRNNLLTASVHICDHLIVLAYPMNSNHESVWKTLYYANPTCFSQLDQIFTFWNTFIPKGGAAVPPPE